MLGHDGALTATLIALVSFLSTIAGYRIGRRVELTEKLLAALEGLTRP